MKSIFISTPCYGGNVSMSYTISILNLLIKLNEKNINFVIDFLGNESLIVRARNKALAKFINSNFTHILFIDSDIEFPAEAVIDLLEFDKDITGCVYPRKGINFKRLLFSLQNEPNSKESIESRGLDFCFNNLNDNENIIKEGNFIRVKETSTGFMMVKKDIVLKMIEKNKYLQVIDDSMDSNMNNSYYALFNCIIDTDKRFLSEDYSFCKRASESGGEIWINTKHDLSHLGTYSFKSNISNRENLTRSINEKIFYEKNINN